MKITVADSAGFCFGVQRAVDMAFQTAREGTPACTLGELIHNPWIVERLREQGIDLYSLAIIDRADQEGFLFRQG